MQNLSHPSGLFILAANSLGNPKDIPERSKSWLREADVLVFEEDRPARLALKCAGLQRTYLKFNEHQQNDTIELVKDALKKNQSVVYMSDQGMPSIADPGQVLLKVAMGCGAKVQIIPGPCAVTAALCACSFNIEPYRFLGFLSRDNQDREAQLEALKYASEAVVIFDTPYRRQKLLGQIAASLGADREAMLALDISGENEAFLCGSIGDVNVKSSRIEGKLNFVLVIAASLPKPKQYRG